MKKTALPLALVVLLLFSALTVRRLLVSPASAQTFENITIKDDGSIEGTEKIQASENIYTLTGNISGSIKIKKSNIVLDGAGFTLQANGDIGIDASNDAKEHPSDRDIWNVTVKNLRITNFKWGIKCDYGGAHTFYGNYISNDVVTRNETGKLNLSWDKLGILFWGSSGNNISHCTIGGSPAIYMHFACSDNTVTENNIVFGADLAISGAETFDKNYWSDYLTRYPNASEVDSSGVWDMPYAFTDSQNKQTFQDNHPLTSPLAIPNFSSVLPTVKSAQEPAVFPISHVVAFVIVVATTAAIGLLVYLKKRLSKAEAKT